MKTYEWVLKALLGKVINSGTFQAKSLRSAKRKASIDRPDRRSFGNRTACGVSVYECIGV